LQQLREHQRMQLESRRLGTPTPSITPPMIGSGPPRDALWDHCRNNLGIARLLVHEGRPDALVATACLMAVESACRAALEQSGLAYLGDLEASLRQLAAPPDIWELQQAGTPARRLAGAERAVAWMASYLKRVAPSRTWGY
jgi:hypothetical protein